MIGKGFIIVNFILIILSYVIDWIVGPDVTYQIVLLVLAIINFICYWMFWRDDK